MVTSIAAALIVEMALCNLAETYRCTGNTRTVRCFDRENGQFLLIDEGWEGYRRIHSTWAHVEIKDGRFWIHEDGTEEGIANLLVKLGVTNEDIVLAFVAPRLRDASAFAIA